MQIFGPLIQGLGQALDLYQARHRVLTENVANAETPGYRRLDISHDFATQLRSKLTNGDLPAVAALRPQLMEDPLARTVRPDGNSVEMESELLEMNRNTVEYNYLTEIVSGNLKQLRMAITGRSY